MAMDVQTALQACHDMKSVRQISLKYEGYIKRQLKQVEDFSGMEKIAYFDKRLDETGQKVGCHPLAGDLCVYQPWGNL